MKRLALATGVIGLLMVPAIAIGVSTPIGAQDTTADRVAALETRVADQDKAIARLAREVARLRGEVSTIEQGDAGSRQGAVAPPPAPAATGVDLTFRGQRDTVTDPFVVQPGVLRFSADYDGSSNFSVWIYGPDNSSDIVFNEIGPYRGEQVVQVAPAEGLALGVRAGQVFLEITGAGPWTISVTQ